MHGQCHFCACPKLGYDFCCMVNGNIQTSLLIAEFTLALFGKHKSIIKCHCLGRWPFGIISCTPQSIGSGSYDPPFLHLCFAIARHYLVVLVCQRNVVSRWDKWAVPILNPCCIPAGIMLPSVCLGWYVTRAFSRALIVKGVTVVLMRGIGGTNEWEGLHELSESKSLVWGQMPWAIVFCVNIFAELSLCGKKS